MVVGTTPPLPKVHNRAGDRDTSRVAMELHMEGEVSPEVEASVRGLMEDLARVATMEQKGMGAVSETVSVKIVERPAPGALDRLQEGQAMYLTVGRDVKIDGVAHGLMEEASKQGIDVERNMGVAFNRMYTVVGKGTPHERELVVVRVWLRDSAARDYWVQRGTLLVRAARGILVEARLHRVYSKGGAGYERANSKETGKQWEAFPPFMRRLGKADPGEWDRGREGYEWQEARSMLMIHGVQGAGKEAMSQAALDGAGEGKERAKEEAKSLASIQAQIDSEGKLDEALAKMDREAAAEAKRRLEAKKPKLGTIDITNKTGGEAELTIVVREYHTTLQDVMEEAMVQLGMGVDPVGASSVSITQVTANRTTTVGWDTHKARHTNTMDMEGMSHGDAQGVVHLTMEGKVSMSQNERARQVAQAHEKKEKATKAEMDTMERDAAVFFAAADTAMRRSQAQEQKAANMKRIREMTERNRKEAMKRFQEMEAMRKTLEAQEKEDEAALAQVTEEARLAAEAAEAADAADAAEGGEDEG